MRLGVNAVRLSNGLPIGTYLRRKRDDEIVEVKSVIYNNDGFNACPVYSIIVDVIYFTHNRFHILSLLINNLINKYCKTKNNITET